MITCLNIFRMGIIEIERFNFCIGTYGTWAPCVVECPDRFFPWRTSEWTDFMYGSIAPLPFFVASCSGATRNIAASY